MRTFTKIELTENKFSNEEINAAVTYNGGLLEGFGFGFDCPKEGEVVVEGMVPSYVDEKGNQNYAAAKWRIILVDRRGMGNHGTFVAVADNQAAFKFQLGATKALFRKLADKCELEAIQASKDSAYTCANCAKGYKCPAHRDMELAPCVVQFLERGNFGVRIIPLLWSKLNTRTGLFLFADEKWAYFSHGCGNYLNVGNDASRVWVKPARR